MGQHFNPDVHDPGDFADAAYDKGIGFYKLLDDLRQQMILAVTASMFHEFEKQFRQFLVREMNKSFEIEKLKPKLWRQELSKIFDLVEGCGWDVRSQPFFQVIDACRLIVNVYKHGEGSSFDELKLKYPRAIFVQSFPVVISAMPIMRT